MRKRLPYYMDFGITPAQPAVCIASAVVKLIERVTAYDDHLSFEFKSGLEIDVQCKLRDMRQFPFCTF